MKRFDRRLFERVFSDAHVIDVDLSEWDKCMSLWVLADHYRDWKGRCPTVVVTFHNVIEFSCHMPPADMRLDNRQDHLQWDIYRVDLLEKAESVRAELSGSRYTPGFIIEFEHTEIREVPIEMVDEVCPGWNKPSHGFARPSIEELYRRRNATSRNSN